MQKTMGVKGKNERKSDLALEGQNQKKELKGHSQAWNVRSKRESENYKKLSEDSLKGDIKLKQNQAKSGGKKIDAVKAGGSEVDRRDDFVKMSVYNKNLKKEIFPGIKHKEIESGLRYEYPVFTFTNMIELFLSYSSVCLY
jgi:hypothetical protein